MKNLVSMVNKPPQWNDQLSAFVLNFNNRVTKPSVKNFQLVDQFDHEKIILQFGRVAKDEFTMDFQWPITPFQAFAIALSSLDSKIACE
jgi:tubby-related protein 1